MIDEKYITHERAPFFEIASQYIEENSKVLDVGSGSGEFSIFCKRNDFYHFDGNKETVDFLSKKYEHAAQGLLPKLPYDDRFFNLIHCSHVVEHLQPQTLYDTLTEFDRCLAENGYLVISAPMMWSGFYDDLSHVKPYNPMVFKKYLCDTKNSSFTRNKISFKYKLERLQYRYQDSLEELIFYDPSRSITSRIFYYLFSKLKKKGLRELKTTGFTIVFRKNA
jgi:SAM-dependent methyltransferase